MSSLERVVIAGASLAGLRAAETLRRRGFDGSIVLVGDEEHLPYDRPPLSKEVLRGAVGPATTGFRQREYFDELGVELELGRCCTGLDPHAGKVETDRGPLRFDGCIIATGASPRRLSQRNNLSGVHEMRTVDDALAICGALSAGPRVVVVGAGFIGAEVAANARARGLDITIVEALEGPLVSTVGEEMARVFARLHRDHGTKLLCGLAVERFEGTERVERVVLKGGVTLEADLVVVGVGVTPNTGWLVNSGLTIDNGVLCDETLCAGPTRIFACGDVAAWPNPLTGTIMRCEHWTNAAEQGMLAARNLLARASARGQGTRTGSAGLTEVKPYPGSLYFWSDQYGIRIQAIGRLRGPAVVVAGSSEDRRFLALYRDGERLGGAIAMEAPRLMMRAKLLFEQQASWENVMRELRAKPGEGALGSPES